MTELSHIETIEKELQQIESSNAWNQVYQKVRSDGTYNFPLTEARTPTNRLLNRYRDVLPYDHSRILLQHPTTDYINASLVKVESIKRQYILTQGPLSSTSQHFWLMVWQQQCKGIVMLNKIIEKNMVKCDQYWPLGAKNGGQDIMVFDGVGLTVELVSEAKHHHYIYRTLRLTETSSGNSREVLHFHFTTWPDFGVPQSPEAFSKFLNVVIKSGCLDPSVGPPIVHCSAGIGRSGTFCLVDTLLVMLERGLCSSNVGTVLEVLLDMRRYRMGLIQTPDQLRFSYQAIVHGGRQRLQRQARLTNGSLDAAELPPPSNCTAPEDSGTTPEQQPSNGVGLNHSDPKPELQQQQPSNGVDLNQPDPKPEPQQQQQPSNGVGGNHPDPKPEPRSEQEHQSQGLITEPPNAVDPAAAVPCVGAVTATTEEVVPADDGAPANGVVEGNGNAGESSSSEEDEGGPQDEDVPPPRPPPRTDSLTRSMIDAQLLLEDNLQQADDDEEEEDEEDEDTDVDSDQGGDRPPPVEENNVSHNSIADRSLPAVPPSPDEPPPPPRPRAAVPSPPTTNGHGGGLEPASSPEMLAARMASEVRRRRQQERTAHISSLVSGIKERKEAAEEWQRRKRWLQPLCVGVIAVGVAGGFWVWRWYMAA